MNDGGLNAIRPSAKSLIEHADALKQAGDFDGAAEQYRCAIDLDARAAHAYNGLGNLRFEQARHAEAIAQFEQALAIDPRFRQAFHNLLFASMCAEEVPAQMVFDRHRAFAATFEAPLLGEAKRRHANEPDPERLLRIGYLSPDLRAHVIGRYMAPVFARHDSLEFEVYCYSCGTPDHYSRELEKMVDVWRDVASLTEDALATAIRDDAIDILVDLCGHGPGNRLLAPARRPAPVQASYLDYATTTGLRSVDFRISTDFLDPPGAAQRYYSEKLIHLGTPSCWAYNPASAPPVAESQAARSGFVTFGCLSAFSRVTRSTQELWARILAAVPGSRIVLLGVPKGRASVDLLAVFESAGVARERVLAHSILSYEAYLKIVEQIDIALAPFPYNGSSTTMDCLWSGVPVIAMRGGESCYTRMGTSVLEVAGLPQLIANDAAEYLRKSTELARSPEELRTLRMGLRNLVERSPLRDHQTLVEKLELAYRTMWREWCKSQRRR